jgi:hypothetical protein
VKDPKNTNAKNEEFGIEFGDVNGIKLYELPFMTQKNEKKSTSGKKKKSRLS